jgi:hypothetical protein
MILVKCIVVGIVQMEVSKRRVKMMRLMMLFAGEASSFYTFSSLYDSDLSISRMPLWLHPSRPNVRYRDSYHRDLMMTGVSSDSCKNEAHANTSVLMHRQTIHRVWSYIRLVAYVTPQHPSRILQCYPSNGFMNRIYSLLLTTYPTASPCAKYGGHVLSLLWPLRDL